MKARSAGPLLGLSLILTATVSVAAADRDGDGLRDAFERRWGVTSPFKADSDGDGVVDSAEDNDNDSLSNLGEQRFRTNPRRRDTDRDGRPDGREDHDGDGISNAREQDRRRIPSGLTPTLDDGANDTYPDQWECRTAGGRSTVHPCVLGDTDGDTTVALFGDSHAVQWGPAFDRAGKAAGWRIVTLLKGACPSVSVTVNIQYDSDQDVTCRQWRENAIDWLRRHPPDLIVITNSDTYTLVPDRRPIVRWQRGLTTTLKALPSRSRVLVLGDTPNNRLNPRKCLKDHPFNMAACQTKRLPPRKRRFRACEKAAAEAAGARFSAIYHKVCTYGPCPVVQGNVLMWRNGGHLTATFARELAPTVRTLVRDALDRG